MRPRRHGDRAILQTELRINYWSGALSTMCIQKCVLLTVIHSFRVQAAMSNTVHDTHGGGIRGFEKKKVDISSSRQYIHPCPPGFRWQVWKDTCSEAEHWGVEALWQDSKLHTCVCAVRVCVQNLCGLCVGACSCLTHTKAEHDQSRDRLRRTASGGHSEPGMEAGQSSH